VKIGRRSRYLERKARGYSLHVIAVTCPYCAKPAVAAHGFEIYHYQPGLWALHFYACFDCKAWVGTHRGTWEPLGKLANATLRKLRWAAHNAFDPLWQRKMRRDKCSRKEARNAGYAWLAGKLGIAVEDCHFGMFDEDQCQAAITICSIVQERLAA
jgi:hypothetical protein